MADILGTSMEEGYLKGQVGKGAYQSCPSPVSNVLLKTWFLHSRCIGKERLHKGRTLGAYQLLPNGIQVASTGSSKGCPKVAPNGAQCIKVAE